MGFLTKIAGLKRPIKPKVVVFTNQQVSATKNDYTDEIATSQMLRGNGSTYGYAIPRDAIKSDLRLEGSPLGKLIGDEFCSATESFIWLGADKNLLVGGGPLTENNGPTYVSETSDDESPLYEQTVGNLVSSSSQYWSIPTAAATQVGTNSFVASIAFKTTATSTRQIMFMYGSQVAGKLYWQLYFNGNGTLILALNDGTNNLTCADTVSNIWQDGKWHIATMVIDRTTNIAYLICDGQLRNSTNIATLTGTLTIAGENFYIGTEKNSSASQVSFFNGSLALFKLINNGADYNVPQVWNMGIREAISSGTYTIPTNDSNKRLNNKFGTPNTDLAYFYSTINLEDGEYEMQIAYEKGSANGKLDIIMDGNTIRSGLDTYNGSTTHNNVDKTYGIKISGGRHLIVIKNNGKNASSSGNTVNLQWINFIKRRGHELGGVDNFLLLGDEIIERNTATLNLISSGTEYYNSQLFYTSPSDTQYIEGTLFIKGGLYRIDYISLTNTNLGKFDLYFGNVQVLTQYDEYSGSAVHNVLKSVYVRLQQGRQGIRLTINGKNASSSGYDVALTSIRGVRLSD